MLTRAARLEGVHFSPSRARKQASPSIRVRREHLIETGKRVRLKRNIHLLSSLLSDLNGFQFSIYVISAAPEEVIQSALEGIVPPDRIFGTKFQYDAATVEIESILRVAAGYGTALRIST